MKNQSRQSPILEPISRASLEGARLMVDAMGDFVGAVANPIINAAATCGCCDIPPACWMPKGFGEYQSRACPCGTALFRVRIYNCKRESATFRTEVRGAQNFNLEITPDTVDLGPMERKWVTVALKIPEDACIGQQFELLVWVFGCNEHYARWTVSVAKGFSGTCIEAEVEDCPDYEHHWYDHFYCARACFATHHGEQDGR